MARQATCAAATGCKTKLRESESVCGQTSGGGGAAAGAHSTQCMPWCAGADSPSSAAPGTWVIPAAVHTQFAECGCSKGLATAALNDKTNHASKQRTRCLACRSDCKFVMGSIIAQNKGRLYTNTRLSKKKGTRGNASPAHKATGRVSGRG